MLESETKTQHIKNVENRLQNLKNRPPDCLSQDDVSEIKTLKQQQKEHLANIKLKPMKNFYTELNEGDSAALKRALTESNIPNNVTKIVENTNKKNNSTWSYTNLWKYFWQN